MKINFGPIFVKVNAGDKKKNLARFFFKVHVGDEKTNKIKTALAMFFLSHEIEFFR